MPITAPQSGSIQCEACGAANDAASLFCSRCTAPLAVVALGNLTDDDRRECLAALFATLADGLKNSNAGQQTIDDPELWHAYLSAFWLRPETALILYAETLAIRSFRNRDGGSWLDLGCGDGIHAGLYSGWRFDAGFDAFQSLDPTAGDVYHHWNPKQFNVSVSKNGRRVTHGVDIKQTAVERAAALGVFETVERADATNLPLPNRSVTTIFSNMLRDLAEPLPAALDECRRVLTDDGVLLISTMTPAYSKNLYFAPAAREAEAAGDIARSKKLLRLDRGRSVFCRPSLSQDDWRVILSQHGFKLATIHPIVGPAVIRFWDVGFRPFSIALLKQRQAWKEAGVLPLIKPGAVDFLARALEPLASGIHIGESCMNLLEVRKA